MRAEMRKILISVLFLALAMPSRVFCGEQDAAVSSPVKSVPYSALKRGKELLDQGRHKEAVESLDIADKETPLMGDYILFFKAEAYNKMGSYEDSSRSVEDLLIKYPESLLKKRARSVMVRNILSDPEKIMSNGKIRYIEQYAADYPEDTGTAITLGRILKNTGESDKARKLFRQVYISNSPYSDSAYRELQTSEISPDDMLSKAENYIKTAEYGRAEALLRKVLPVSAGSVRKEMQKTLADALFSRKKYKEAADWYLKAGDVYNAARSFFRAEEEDAFNKTMSALISGEDKRAGMLLVAYASKKRREGRIDEALKIYSDAGQRYPLLAEEALWGTAWTHYLNGDYRKSLKMLTELSARYRSSRYLYWKQRCLERLAQSAGGSDGSLAAADGELSAAGGDTGSQKAGWPVRDFYGLLARMRNIGKLSGYSASRASLEVYRVIPHELRDAPGAEFSPYTERFNILTELDMKEDAAAELINTANKISRPEVIIYISRRLQEAGAYRKSIGLAAKFQWGEEAADILYPMAYWPVVSEAADQYAIDPFVLLSLIREESRFDARASSPAGAIGLMQIMPGTAYSFDKKLGLGISDREKIFDVRTNVALGSYYLNNLLKEFGALPVALAAYNAGEEKVRLWLKKGDYKSPDEFIEDVPYDETRNYIKRILISYAAYLELNKRLK